MAHFLSRFAKGMGVDLGTSNTLIFVQDRGIVINEPSVVSVDMRTDHIVAVGDDARKMIGKNPPHIKTTQPITTGIIADFEVAEKMLKYFFDKIQRSQFSFAPRPRVVVGIPLDITEVERKAVEDATLSAGARQVYLVENVVCAAIGARLPIQDASGNMIVDFGGGLTQIAVISLDGIVNSRTIRLAGNDLDQDIIRFAREHYNLLLGSKIAEEIKIKVGSALPLKQAITMKMRGRDLLTGLPREVEVNDTQIREAIGRTLKTLVDHIITTLETTPPELVADIYEKGIIMTGGQAMLRELGRFLHMHTHVPVHVTDDPQTSAVRGMGVLLDNEPLLRDLTIQPTTRAFH